MKYIVRVLCLSFFALVSVSNANSSNVFEVKGVEVSFKNFNAQKTRTQAVDLATKKGFFRLIEDIVPAEYQNMEEIKRDIDFKKIDLVEKINIVDEKSNGGYWVKFDILYKQDTIKRILQEKRIPFTQRSMGRVLLLAIQSNGEQSLLFEDSNKFRDVLSEELSSSRLIDPILPQGELSEVAKLSSNNIMSPSEEKDVLEVAKNYSTDKVIIAKIVKGAGLSKDSYRVNLKFLNLYGLENLETVVIGSSIEEASKQIAENIKNIWKKENLLEFNKPKRFLAYVETKGNLNKLDEILKKLREMSIVSSVDVVEVSMKEALLRTDFYGSPTEFLEESKNSGLKIYQEGENNWFIDYSDSMEIR